MYVSQKNLLFSIIDLRVWVVKIFETTTTLFYIFYKWKYSSFWHFLSVEVILNKFLCLKRRLVLFLVYLEFSFLIVEVVKARTYGYMPLTGQWYSSCLNLYPLPGSKSVLEMEKQLQTYLRFFPESCLL